MAIAPHTGNTLAGRWLPLLALVIATGVVVGGTGPGRGIPYQADMAQAAATTVAALLAVSLFLERGMAVVNALLYGDEQREADIKLSYGFVDEGVRQIAAVASKKERIRLVGAFVAGVFVSAAGVRTLQSLLQVRAGEAYPLLFPADIVLTASLLAGGSNGLAFLSQLIKDRLAPLVTPTPGAPLSVKADSGIAAAAGPNLADLRARLTTG